jgi:hypothetical protein
MFQNFCHLKLVSFSLLTKNRVMPFDWAFNKFCVQSLCRCLLPRADPTSLCVIKKRHRGSFGPNHFRGRSSSESHEGSCFTLALCRIELHVRFSPDRSTSFAVKPSDTSFPSTNHLNGNTCLSYRPRMYFNSVKDDIQRRFFFSSCSGNKVERFGVVTVADCQKNDNDSGPPVDLSLRQPTGNQE